MPAHGAVGPPAGIATQIFGAAFGGAWSLHQQKWSVTMRAWLTPAPDTCLFNIGEDTP